MKIIEIKNLLEASVYAGEEFLECEVNSACGSDLMSDVLAFVKDQAVLLTGLVNQQTIRTAEMMDMKCIVLVRGKTPDEGMIELANENEIVLLSTEYRMYEACGTLYSNGFNQRGV